MFLVAAGTRAQADPFTVTGTSTGTFDDGLSVLGPLTFTGNWFTFTTEYDEDLGAEVGGTTGLGTFSLGSGPYSFTNREFTLTLNLTDPTGASPNPSSLSATVVLRLDDGTEVLRLEGMRYRIHLDLPGYSPVVDLVNKPERLDREMLEGMMMRHSSGLHVLTTPEAPLPVEAINSEIVERLLQIARNRYAYTVVDMPQTMTLWTDAVLRKSEVIYVVTQLNVPAIRQLRRWLSVLEHEGLGNLPIRVVVNRHIPFGRMRNDNISLAQAAEALGREVDFTIQNDYELISQSLDQGMPAASIRSHSAVVRAIGFSTNRCTPAASTRSSRITTPRSWSALVATLIGSSGLKSPVSLVSPAAWSWSAPTCGSLKIALGLI